MFLGYSQMVRHSFLIRKIEGSNPSIPEKQQFHVNPKTCYFSISYRKTPVG